jgi:hypothetical protein
VTSAPEPAPSLIYRESRLGLQLQKAFPVEWLADRQFEVRLGDPRRLAARVAVANDHGFVDADQVSTLLATQRRIAG